MPRLSAVAAGLIAAQALVAAASARAEDRYGPAPLSRVMGSQAAGGELQWPGKTAPAAPDVVQTQTAAPGDETQPISIYGVSPLPRPAKLRGVILADADPHAMASPADAMTAAPPPPPPAPVTTTPPPPAAAPTPMPMPPLSADLPPASPPAPAAATPATTPTTDAANHSATPARFYSVAREYGVTPDRDPLPAQFFADSAGADLAAPPPPLDPRPVPGTQAATSPANTASNRARQSAIATADAGADGPVGGAGGN